jgi:acetyl-CoA acetyltransferase
MMKIAIGRTHSLEPGNLWDKGLSDLLAEAAAPVVSGIAVDGVFCAGVAVPERQADPATIVADRLGLDPVVALSFDCADVSGAAALFAAFQHLRAGACRQALVVGAAKVSDASEPQRLALMDQSLDRDADSARGIDFTTQAGLLAGHYCRERVRDAAIFAEATASNLAAWAAHAKLHAPTAAELRRDLLVSPPLVRSDFPQLLDGGCALLLSDVEDCESPRLVVDAMASGSDIVSVWERKDPLAFEAVRSALRRLPDTGAPDWLEIDAGVGVAQILCEDALDAVLAGNSSARRRNRRGGSYGRGRVIGSSALYQLGDIREIAARDESALLLAVSGLGSHVFVARLSGIA